MSTGNPIEKELLVRQGLYGRSMLEWIIKIYVLIKGIWSNEIKTMLIGNSSEDGSSISHEVG